MFQQIDLLNWGLLFVSYLALDVLYTKNMLYTYRLESLKSANVGVFIYLLSVYGTVQYIENLWNVIPIAAGSWVGTYWTLQWEIKKIKDENNKRGVNKSPKVSNR